MGQAAHNPFAAFVPVVISINRATPTGPATNGPSVVYTVTFNKVVTGVDATDFNRVLSGVTAGTPIVAGSGSTYTVTVNAIAGIGTLGLNLLDDDSITDSVGTPLHGPGVGNGSLTGQVYNVDSTFLAAPTQNGPSGNIAAAAGYDAPLFSWSTVGNANHYYLYVVDNTSAKVVINNPTVNTTSFTATTPFTPGHAFTWYVGAISADGLVNSYLPNGQTFTLAALAAPTQTSPTGTIAASAGYDLPTFNWGTVAGAHHYYLYVVDNTGAKVVINNRPSTPLRSPRRRRLRPAMPSPGTLARSVPMAWSIVTCPTARRSPWQRWLPRRRPVRRARSQPAQGTTCPPSTGAPSPEPITTTSTSSTTPAPSGDQ